MILSSGLQGTCPCLLLSLERPSCMGDSHGRVYRRYLINAGENTQRLCMEHRVKTLKVCGVFLCRSSAAYCGGLGGLHFSMADSGSATLEIRGPHKAKKIVDNYQHFVRRKWPRLNMVSVQSAGSQWAKYEDSNLIQTLAITLTNSLPKSQAEQQPCCHWCNLESSDSDTSGESESESSSSESDDDESEGESESSGLKSASDEREAVDEEVALCYIFRVFKSIHPGANSVVEGSSSRVIAVVDCPSASHVQSLVHSVHLRRNSCTHSPSFVFHLAPKEVVRLAEYQRWCQSFPADETTHVYVHHSNYNGPKQDLLRSSAQWTTKLKVAAPALFPIEFDSARGEVRSAVLTKYLLFETQENAVDESACAESLDLESCKVEAKRLLGIDPNAMDIDPELTDCTPLATQQRSRKRLRSCKSGILFLGTGASKPSRLRGCSSILVELGHENAYFLLDVGEGTYTQLVRCFGEGEADRIISRLKAIWISHHHYDHHGGFLRILEIRKQLQDPSKLQIWGPASVGNALEGHFLGPKFYNYEHCSQASEFKHSSVLGLTTVSVNHCYDAFAVGLDLAISSPRDSTRKIRVIYSGDTRPCTRLIEAFKDRAEIHQCILIHEATFDDSLLNQAKKKRHSTINEALNVGRSIGADITLLTHFSQRYPNLAANETSCSQEAQSEYVVASDFFWFDLVHPERTLSQKENMMKLMRQYTDEKRTKAQGSQ